MGSDRVISIPNDPGDEMKLRSNVSDTPIHADTAALTTDTGSLPFQVRRLGRDEDAPWCLGAWA